MPPIYIFHKYWTLLPPSSSHSHVTFALQPLLLLSPRTSLMAAAAPFHKVLLCICHGSPPPLPISLLSHLQSQNQQAPTSAPSLPGSIPSRSPALNLRDLLSFHPALQIHPNLDPSGDARVDEDGNGDGAKVWADIVKKNSVKKKRTRKMNKHKNGTSSRASASEHRRTRSSRILRSSRPSLATSMGPVVRTRRRGNSTSTSGDRISGDSLEAARGPHAQHPGQAGGARLPTWPSWSDAALASQEEGWHRAGQRHTRGAKPSGIGDGTRGRSNVGGGAGGGGAT